MGLVNAREELIQVLAAGLAGDYDQVSATRIWAEQELVSESNATPANEEHDAEPVGNETDERGFLDIMADAEEQQEELVPALNAVGECVQELGELSETSTEEIARSDAAGKGMRGRLLVTTRHANGLDAIANRLEAAVDRYASVLLAVSAGTLALIGRMEEDRDDLDAGREFGMITRRLAAITRESMTSFAGMVDSINSSARMSRVLREPSHRLTTSLGRFVENTSIIDEWDRRLQSLGIPIPPEDCEPDSAEDSPEGSNEEPDAPDERDTPDESGETV
jgi:hypothetical protein